MIRSLRPILTLAVLLVLPLALGALLLAPETARAQRVISLTVSDFGFTKETLQAEPGEEVTIRLTNAGLGSHGIRFTLDGGRTETIAPMSIGRQEDLTFAMPQARGAYVYDDARAESAITGTLYVGIEPPTPVPTGTRPPTRTPEATATPEPVTSTPTALPAPEVSFTADDETLAPGGCTTLRWEAAGVQAVYLEGEGVAGAGEREVCPTETTTYTLEVVLLDGSRQSYEVIVTVAIIDVLPVYLPRAER